MTWWVLTYLHNDRDLNSLHVLSKTNHPAHLIMAWSTVKPARSPVYRSVRGTRVFCGWKYIWNSPHLAEQTWSGDTFTHIFGPIALQPEDHVWYLLSSTRTLYQRYCQSPLIHVPPPEVRVASARIYHSIDQTFVGCVETFLTFDSVSWDDAFFYDPANPTKLNISLRALYEFGACASFSLAVGNSSRLGICVNGGPDVVRSSEHIGFVAIVPHVIAIHTLWPLQPGDFLQVRAHRTPGLGQPVSALPDFSPHFWVRLVGAYPI